MDGAERCSSAPSSASGESPSAKCVPGEEDHHRPDDRSDPRAEVEELVDRIAEAQGRCEEASEQRAPDPQQHRHDDSDALVPRDEPLRDHPGEKSKISGLYNLSSMTGSSLGALAGGFVSKVVAIQTVYLLWLPVLWLAAAVLYFVIKGTNPDA